MNKGLEALERLKHTTDLSNPLYGWTNELNTIETELKRLEELEKERKELMQSNIEKSEILRIIKEKEVAVFVINDTNSYDEYNARLFAYGTNQELTKEEYDLLKEVL